MGTSLLAASAIAQEADPEPPPSEESPPESSREDPGDDEADEPTSDVHVVVFVGSAPAAGVRVELAGAEPTLTNEQGSAVLVSRVEGKRRVRLVVPRDRVPEAPGQGSWVVELREVQFAAGATAEIIVTLTRRGGIQSVDVEGVEAEAAGAARARAEREAQMGKPKGTVAGTVFAQEGERPVAGARVFARGIQAEATTDGEGRFTLSLPQGEWTLSVIHSDYSTETSNVKVAAGQTAQLRMQLTPASVTLDDFVVVAPHVEGTVASILDARRDSASLTDAISAQDIARTPAGDAAGAAQRIVGVTVVDGRFVYVRGLGERYTNALVNGAPLPSPEPDKATVPLDLFPTQVIRVIDIAKTFTPDVPADFAGGSVRIETITVPEKRILAASVSGGWNSQATFKKRLSYPGDSGDWLGLKSDARQLPGQIPDDYPLKRGQARPDGSLLGQTDINAFADRLNTPLATTRSDTLPNHGASLMLGDGFGLGGNARLGALAALTYSRKFAVRDEVIREFKVAGAGAEDDVSRWIDSKANVARDSIRWGAFGSIALELGKAHEISLIGLRSQLADNTTSVFDTFYANNDTDYGSSRFEYITRSLEFAQLAGRHDFAALYDARLEWRASLSRAGRNEPDTRDVVYTLNPSTGVYSFLPDPGSGRHFFSDMTENARGAGIDWTQPFERGDREKKVKLGAALNSKDRLFDARRFRFAGRTSQGGALECGPEFDPSRCPRELFTSENVNGSLLQLQEDTANTDAYKATSDIHAGYLMGDVKLTNNLRVIAGARVERTELALVPFDQFTKQDIDDSSANLESTDVLPSLSAVYSFGESLEVRAAASRTLARPQLRELAPFTFTDYFAGAQVYGNPELTLTTITNADLRLDFFTSPREVISFSVFAKDFEAPIEPVLQPSGTSNVRTYQNADGAFLMGAELEARQGLGFITDVLEDVSLMGNITLARSRIRVQQTGGDESGVGFITNTERPMVNQSPYVINLALDYEGPTKTSLRLLYNVAGRQIFEVGTVGLDDSYLQPRHVVDFTAAQSVAEHFLVKFTAENILNAPYMVTLGRERREERSVRSYKSGTVLSMSFGYRL
ncbi:MAG TPA: TonB-dependent receptor [Polyangiaceae bacterium]